MPAVPRPREFSDTSVLDAAMDVFWSKGYEATSTADLCDRTGLGRGSLYNAFGSKHRLYEEVLRHYADIGIRLQVEILERPGQVKERLRALMLWVIETDLDDQGRRGCLAINAAVDAGGRDAVVAEVVRRQFEDLESAIRELVVFGQGTGEITTDRSAARIARSVLSSYYGLRVLGKVVSDREMLMDVVEGTLAGI